MGNGVYYNAQYRARSLGNQCPQRGYYLGKIISTCKRLRVYTIVPFFAP